MLDALPAEYSARARAWCAVWTFGFSGRPGVWKEQEQQRFMEGSSVLIHVCAIRSRIGLLYSPGKGHVPGMSGSSAAWIRSIQYAWMDGFLARRSAGSIKISSRESACMNMIPWWLIPWVQWHQGWTDEELKILLEAPCSNFTISAKHAAVHFVW